MVLAENLKRDVNEKDQLDKKDLKFVEAFHTTLRSSQTHFSANMSFDNFKVYSALNFENCKIIHSKSLLRSTKLPDVSKLQALISN